ncbi:MAG: hypothetical protein EOP87_02725, partial [Verrucomicrobiaceae bacterium]
MPRDRVRPPVPSCSISSTARHGRHASSATTTSDNIATRLSSGEVSAHFWWDGEELKNRTGGAPLAFAMTKEGLVGWLDSMVIPKGAPNQANAVKF